MTRIMFLGDMAGTGFGTVTQDLGKALLAKGHDVRFVSQNEIGELPEPFASRTFIVNDPQGWHQLRRGGGVLGLLDGKLWTDGWHAEAAIVLGDYYAVREVALATPEIREAFGRIPSFHYVPIEGVGLPPAWADLWEVVTPVAMSKFGADQIHHITGELPHVIYHGVDTEQFRPVTPKRPLRLTGEDNDGNPIERVLRSKADCKKMFGGSPDQKWMLRTDRHMPRKRYPSLFRALAPVLGARGDAFLVVHCRSEDQGGNLNDTLSKYPPAIRQRIVNTGFHDQVGGASRDVLTALYNAADLYVSVSAEGFGLTIAEALACGTPALGMDYSAVPEVIGPGGMVAPVGGLIDNEYDHFWAGVDEKAFGKLAHTLLGDESLLRSYAKAGPEYVRASFSWEQAAAEFTRLVEYAPLRVLEATG